jgi:hypothetical protein
MDAFVEKLWRNNWLNIRQATDVALQRSPPALYIGIELSNTAIENETGQIYNHVLETFDFLKSKPYFYIIIDSYLDEKYITQVINTYKIPYHWINANMHFATPYKPFRDCTIDVTAGFKGNEWQYVLGAFKMSSQTIESNNKPKLFR